VLVRSRRRCALCYGLKGDFEEKIGQIAHIDQNRSNDSLENLAWLCFEHHSLYDSTTSQHKNYQSSEIKRHRGSLYTAVATSAITGPESMGRYVATQDTATVIRLPDRIVVIFDWPLRCAPTLWLHPPSLPENVDVEGLSMRGFQLLVPRHVDAKDFAFFADASPREYKEEATRQREEWKSQCVDERAG
jgi:hypothetical protein